MKLHIVNSGVLTWEEWRSAESQWQWQ